MTDNGNQGQRVLVVEDEVLISMLLEEMLADLGHEVVGPAARIDEALQLAREATIDAAVLDLHLNGVEAYPVADVLRARGIPFIFATGYGTGLAEGFSDVPTVQKPYDREDLERAVAAITERRTGG